MMIPFKPAIYGCMLGFVVLFAGTPASAGLGEAGELEAARANARAGGPVSERDAELLERYGCLSGTDSAFCRRLEQRNWHNNGRWRKH